MSGDPVTDGGSDDGSELGVDEVFSLLSDRYRRHVLACLDGQPGPVPLERLTDEVAGREFQQPPDKVSIFARTEIATALHHNHLPTLEERGTLTYDDEAGEVTEITIDGTLERFLDRIRRHEG